MYSNFIYNHFETAMKFRFAEIVIETSKIEEVEEYSVDKFEDEAYYDEETGEYDTESCPNWIIMITYTDKTYKELLYNIECNKYVVHKETQS